MLRIKKDNWYLEEDRLFIPLMRFHVEIKQIVEDKKTHWTISIINNEMEELKIGFRTLEECIFFTENYIDLSTNFEEILEKKKEYKKIIKPNQKEKVKTI